MRILIIGVLNHHASTAAKIAISKGARVAQVTTIDEALQDLRSGKGTDLIMVDLNLDIKRLVTSLQQERISVSVVACGIAVDPQKAAQAIRDGAKDYLPLPPDPELIAAVINAFAGEESSLLCNDIAMQRIVTLADRIAPSEANILITGESGTGKEVVSRYIHTKSKRKSKPFISINCAAIPENLLESELFGHEKGAFTGAISRRVGKFEEAHGGTLLLDEVTEMHPRLQAKLLRAIQERVIDRVGGTQPVHVDIRIIATSNRDMREAVTQNEFREDLYFRLNVVNLHLPPLRERRNDVEVLAKHFITKFCNMNHVALKTLSKESLDLMRGYEWRGNVRELENVIHRAVLLSTGTVIQADDLMIRVDNSEVIKVASNDHALVGRTVEDVERELILGTVDHCLGNRTHAANILGISIRTLRNKLREYNITGDDQPLSVAAKGLS